MHTHLSLLLSSALGFLLVLSSAQACTGGALVTQDGAVVSGRTLEFATPLNSDVVVHPAGSLFQGDTPKGPKTGKEFTAKYGFCGMDAFGQRDAIVEGLNDQGLSVGLFYFPGTADYMKDNPAKYQQGLSPIQLGTYLLASCKNVEEVKQAIGAVSVLPVYLEALKQVPPVHFKVIDASGQCIVIEPLGGELKVFNNPVRCLTNSPEFTWHLTNLTNYVTQSPAYPKSQDINGLSIEPNGMGAGMAGLPGDFTPPSRFVRITAFTSSAPKQPNVDTATATLFHILNNFDIPPGSARTASGMKGLDGYDYTTWTSVSDLQNKRFFWKTYGDQNIRSINLTKSLAEGKFLVLDLPNQDASSVGTAIDMTGKLTSTGQ